MRRYRQSKAIRWMTRTVRCQLTRCEGGVDSPLSLIRILLGTARADGRSPLDGWSFSTTTPDHQARLHEYRRFYETLQAQARYQRSQCGMWREVGGKRRDMAGL